MRFKQGSLQRSTGMLIGYIMLVPAKMRRRALGLTNARRFLARLTVANDGMASLPPIVICRHRSDQ
jgi:hypothetical protein